VSSLTTVFFIAVLTLLGLLFGSFANVVIWRVPRGESVAFPASHCPVCETPIAWYDNIPVLSWLSLRGRCRACAAPIARRYPLVEIASGSLALTAALAYGPAPRAVFAAVLFWFLLVLSMIDIEHYRLPNVLVAALAVVGVVGVALGSFLRVPVVPLLDGGANALFTAPYANAIAGAVIGAGLSGAIAAVYALARGRQGLGMGDIKLLGVLGVFLGPLVVVSLFLGSLIGLIVGIASARGSRFADARIPFGPSLAAAAVITALVGPVLWERYLVMLGVG